MPIPTLGIFDMKNCKYLFYHKILIYNGTIVHINFHQLCDTVRGEGVMLPFHQLTHYSCPQGARRNTQSLSWVLSSQYGSLAGFLFTVLLGKLAYRFFHSARAVSAASSHLLYLGLVFCQPTSRPFVDSRPFVYSRTFVDSRTGRFPRGPK